MVDLQRQIFRNMNILHVKSVILTSCESDVVSGDFCCFKLALLSLLSKDINFYVF